METKDLGDVEWFLGVKIDRTEDLITISQKAYIEKVFSDIGIKNSYKVAILYNPKTAEKAVSKILLIYDKDFVKNYALAIGQVIYPTYITRINGCFAANL